MKASEPSQQRGRILLIDDDPALGGYLTRVLRARGGFDVTYDRAGRLPGRLPGRFGDEHSLVTP